MIRVHVWAEDEPLDIHAQSMRDIYPSGIEGAIVSFLSECDDMKLSSSVLRNPEQGLGQDLLSETDVLVFWSHKHWRKLDDETAERVCNRVLNGMGLIVLHSAHASKIFARLMGTRTQCLGWKEADETQRYWIVAPHHPIARGLESEYFDVPTDETYREYFEIPNPDELIFITGSPGGSVFRSGCSWTRGRGKIFYLQAGHETYPVYYQNEIQTIITNAVRWATASHKYSDWPEWAREI